MKKKTQLIRWDFITIIYSVQCGATCKSVIWRRAFCVHKRFCRLVVVIRPTTNNELLAYDYLMNTYLTCSAPE